MAQLINKIIIVIFVMQFMVIHITNAGISNNCNHIIGRYEWGGRAPKQVEYSIFPLDYVIIHHTVTDTCNSETSCSELITNIQTYFMDNLDYHDIGYNFLVGNNGKIYEGVGWHKIGAHTFGYNSKSIGIAFIGDFSKTEPHPSQINATLKLLQCGVELGELKRDYKVLAGRQVIATKSPGLKLYQAIQKWKNWTPIP